ncbi:MAG TPA: serine/threonine-protein kinase [Thermoanaerobaculia bacterium]|nr:serine/threonine-protein kinase [Thermoanaerobaculia bacterium]
MKSFFWTRLIPSLALFKLASGLVAFFLAYGAPAGRDPSFPYPLYLVFIGEFGIPAALLLFGGRGDPRAVALGSFFLMGITAWCNRPLALATALYEGTAGRVFHFANAFELDCLMAFFLWSFVREFPVPTRAPARRWIDGLVRISAGAGLALFGLNLVKNLAAGPLLPPVVSGVLAELVPMRGMGLYYMVLMPLIAPAIPYLVWKGRSLEDDEFRRVRLFVLSIAVGLGPMLLDVLAELFILPYRKYSHAHPGYHLGILLVFGLCTLAVPLGTSYAVLVHRALNVKLLARRAAQYTLARTSAIALATAPLAALAVYLYQNRERSLVELFSGSRLLLLLTAALAGAAALRYRRPLLDAIDRRFFREQYDARQILTLLVERIRATGDAASLASLIAREIDLALHLEGIALLVLDVRSGMLGDPCRRTQRLDSSSPLALLIANASDPLSTDLEDPRSPVSKLPEKERHWLVDSAFKLVVPILARDGSLLGLIGLGEKKSGLPFLREDKQLLHAVASSAAWVLELAQAQSLGTLTPSRRAVSRDAELLDETEAPTAAELAKECPACGALFLSYTVLCIHCSRRLEPSHVPYVLPGKFRFERRIGSGGMGVVYRGADLSLGRPVAVKTLRRVSPEDAMRLRREARTAASVSHRHLAPVYGMETWQGTPMLVLELLEGGTLAQQLERSRLTPRETVELGIAVADALAQLHSVDILHRDIKPSNIGFTRDGVPKLMDFGIARVHLDLRHDRLSSSFEGEEDDSLLPPTAVWHSTPTSLTLSKQLVGTLSYLSPEALAGEPADASFDLWSLAIVLYECLLGRKVFGGDPKQVMARIKQGRVPELSQVLPDADEGLGELFRTALHKNRARRPATARELKQKLEALLNTAPPSPRSAASSSSQPPDRRPPGGSRPGAGGASSDSR